MLGLHLGLTQFTIPDGSQGTHRDMLGGQVGPSPGKGSGNSSPIISKGIKEPYTQPDLSPATVDRPQCPPLSEMWLDMLTHINPLCALSVAQGPVELTLHLNTESLQCSSPPLTMVEFFRETEVPLAPVASCMAILRLGLGSLPSVTGLVWGVRVT